MKLHFGFERHQSKIATLISFFQSGIVGLILLWIFFNIPSFIVLICGVEEPVPAILFGVMSGVAILAFVGILFIDTDKVDDFMTRKNKPKHTEQDDAIETYLPSILELVLKHCPRQDWVDEFVFYSFFKARVAFVSILEMKKETQAEDFVSSFDYLLSACLANYYKHWESGLETYFDTRLLSYEKVFTMYPIDSFAMTAVGQFFRWFLVNHNICVPVGFCPAVPYDKNFVPLKLNTALTSEQERVLCEYEVELIDFISQRNERFIERLATTIKKNNEDIF